MPPEPPIPPPQRVIILSTNRLASDAILAATASALPTSTAEAFHKIADVIPALQEGFPQLLVASTALGAEDVLTLLSCHFAERRDSLRSLIIADRCDARLLLALYRLRVRGVFDPSSEGTAALVSALRAMAVGSSYWSATMIARLRDEVLASNSTCSLLTPTEQISFALMGDGSSDDVSAEFLNLKPASIAKLRASIYQKLGLHDKSQLMRRTLETGYVRIESGVMLRPGLSLLIAARRPRRKPQEHVAATT